MSCFILPIYKPTESDYLPGKAQHAEWDLNKIEKTFNGTFAG